MSTTIMNEMVKRGHDVGLITWDKENAESHYNISGKIKWMRVTYGNADVLASWKIRFLRHKRMRGLIKDFKPGVIIGFQTGAFFSARISSIFLNIPVIAAERNSLDRYRFTKAVKIRKIIFLSLTLARRITVQFSSYIDTYPSYLKHKIVAIPNPVISSDYHAKIGEDQKKIILHVGRLSFQKNQDFLFRSFAEVVKVYPDWKLVVIGDGEKESELKKLVGELNLSNNIVFKGAVKNVTEYYLNAQIFTLPSLWEGFPNALAEALAHGLPSIGIKETKGINELIVDGENGLLTDFYEKDYAEGIIKLIEDSTLRKTMGEKAVNSVKKYDPEKVFDLWEEMFKYLGSAN